ncbi:MAG: monovalent cation/H(+) antiporter subunit G [Verrucomicrobiia bacterium]
MIQEILTVSLTVLGSMFILISGIGLLRFPDLYCRAHSMGKAMTLGLTLLLLGLWVHLGVELSGLKVVLAIFFQFLTIPVAGHLLCLLASRKNLPRWRGGKRKLVTSGEGG